MGTPRSPRVQLRFRDVEFLFLQKSLKLDVSTQNKAYISLVRMATEVS